ncbi:regulatory protein RecX [Motiliproteus sediminis]|uniref:regulatory protein RecX n=1 Tax=Motiliproteus sediminis TaxID=1468178 RepID=UPI001AEF7FF6
MDEITQQLRNRAIALLARREHSQHELTTKLAGSEASAEQVAEVIAQLQADGLQSDERYAASLVRSLVARGQGPLRVHQSLKQKGVSGELARLALEAADVDWFSQAEMVQQKRFGDVTTDTPKEYARQVRFMLYRGFDQDQVRHALDQARQRAALTH